MYYVKSILQGVLKMSLLSELNITKEELKVVQDIAKSHPYFPELAMDDFTFNITYKSLPKKTIDSLIDKFIAYKKGEKVHLVRALASNYWNDIVNSIEVQLPVKVDRKFLEGKDFKVLKKSYTILTSKSPIGLSKDKIIDSILTFYQEKKDMVEKTKEKKTAAPKKTVEGITPKEAATKTGIAPQAFRKMLRKLYGKTEGSWSLTEKQIEEVVKAYKEYKEEAAKAKSERMAKLQEARKAKAEKKTAEAKPVAKKAPAKKSK